MKSSKFVALTILLSVLFFVQSTLLAQEEKSAEKPYWYISSYKVPWSKIDSLEKLVKMYLVPVVAEAKKYGKILDYHYLIHEMGDEYNVVIMRKYSSWRIIDEDTSFEKAIEALEPDKAKRDSVNSRFNWVFKDSVHKDNIYHELTE